MPALVVTFTDGQKRHFDDPKLEIVRFGRDPNWADVILDEHLAAKGVGREHCELVASAGCFSLEMNDRNQVWVDGKKAFDGDILPRCCYLSFTNAPTDTGFKLETILSGGIETKYFGPVEEKGSHFKKATLFSLAVLLVVTAFIFYRATPTEKITAEQIEYFKERIFSVQTQVNGVVSHAGTAWLAAKNTVITNRHVAEYIQQNLNYSQLGLDASSFIRFRSVNNEQGKIKKIKRVIFHPAESAYKEFLNQHPVRVSKDFSLNLDIYDIAILELEGSPIELSPLPLASAQSVLKLESGAPLLLLGYPLNVGGNAWDLLKPVAETSYGKFDRTRNAFSSEGVREVNPLISYDMTTSGGNSGSPVINSKGQVVAIHFAGSKVLIEGAKVAGKNKAIRLDAGGKSYGQNVRLIKQLVDGSIFDQDTMISERAIWLQWLATTPSIKEMKLSEMDSQLRYKYRCEFNYMAPWNSLNQISTNKRRSKLEFLLPVQGEYLVFIQSFDPAGKKIDVSAHTESNSYTYFGNNHHYDFNTQLSKENTLLDLTLGGPSSDANFGVNIFVWSDKNCEQDNYVARKNQFIEESKHE